MRHRIRRWQELANRNRGWFGAAALIAAIGFAIVAWGWAAGDERRALSAVPTPERTVMFERVRSAAEAVCDPRAAHRLRERCESFAGFLLEFPECDEACVGFVRSVSSQPAR